MARKSKAQRKERRKKILTKVRKGGKLIMKVGMVPSRAAFISAVSLNLFNLATRLTQLAAKNPNAVTKFWENFGGDMKKLNKAIIKGLSVKRKKEERKAKKRGSEVSGHDSEIGSVSAGAIIAAALPIVTAVLKAFNSNKSDKAGDDKHDKANVEKLKKTLRENSTDKILDSKADPEETAVSGLMENKPLLIGGGLAVLLGAYLLMKKK
jgi:hypothetical protein